jgi:hypothetical protein
MVGCGIIDTEIADLNFADNGLAAGFMRWVFECYG